MVLTRYFFLAADLLVSWRRNSVKDTRRFQDDIHDE